MLAPAIGALLFGLLSAALIASLRRSRALLRATHALRESHARHLLDERVTQEKVRLQQERAAFLADVSTIVSDTLDAPVALATVARIAVPFLADSCLMDLSDGDGGLARVAAVHADPSDGATLARHFRAAAPVHPLLSRVLREGTPQRMTADFAPWIDDDAQAPAGGLLIPLVARGRTLGVMSLFSHSPGRHFSPDERALAVDNARLYHAADDARNLFHDLVEGLGAIVWEADAARSAYTFVSGRAVALLGHPLNRWYDEPDFWLSVQHPGDRERSVALNRSATAEGADHPLEYRVVAADGRIVWMLDLVRVVRQADGTVRRLRGVMIDISERKRAELLEREGEEDRRHAAQLASVAELATAAAHEINNPLTIIQGNLDLFMRRPDLPHDVGGRLETMLAAGERIADIVGRMRRIIRLERAPGPAGLPVMLDLRRSTDDADDT